MSHEHCAYRRTGNIVAASHGSPDQRRASFRNMPPTALAFGRCPQKRGWIRRDWKHTCGGCSRNLNRAEAIRLLASVIADLKVDIYCFSVGASASPPSIPRVIIERAERLGISIGVDHHDSTNDESVA